MKKILSLILAMAMIIAIAPATYADNSSEELKNEGVVEYRISDYFSRSLPMFNIATGGESNYFIVSSPSLPASAKITKVVLTGSKSGGRASWIVLNESGGAMRNFKSTTIFDEFNGETANTDWGIYIIGDNWTTVRNARFKVYYRY